MTKTLKYLAIFVLLMGCALSRPLETKSNAYKELDSMYQHHQYFELKDRFSEKKHLLQEVEAMYLESQILSVFNRRKASDSLITVILNRFDNKLSAEQKLGLLETKISNNLFLYDYKEAQRSTEKLLAMHSLSPEKQEEHQNQLIIFQELSSTPPQQASITESQLPLKKDLAGLSRIPIKINNRPEEVIFDTGANFSVITDSLAIKTGIRIKNKTFKVRAITGGKVDSRIGVADSIRIGNTQLKNVVFLVFPEASLTFKEADYTIDAILGFPVINALEKIEIINERKFIISPTAPTSYKENMALDFLTPIVEVNERGRSLAFTFDTGANTTALYEDYFRLNEALIKEKGKRDSINLGGAGGTVRIPVYTAPFSGEIGNSKFHLDSANIYLKNELKNPGIYGNLGQDILQQFDTLSLDFRNMRIELK